MIVDWKSTKNMASHLVAFHATTKGACGPLLGTDEEDIVLLQLLVWDFHSRKTLFENQYIVRPNDSNESEYILSDDCKNEFGLSEEYVKAGELLPNAIHSIDAIFRKLGNDGHSPYLITDGQLHLRQVMHPKATAVSIDLSHHFNTFFDIRKEFRKMYQPQEETNSLKEMFQYINMKGDETPNLAVRTVRDIAILVHRMSSDGHTFTEPEEIHTKLEPGICTRGEEVDNACVVRARGLPWQSSDQDIAKFFRGLNIAKGGVALCLSSQGRRNGEALVRFESAEHRDMALKRHKHHIANRYIEVYKATGEDFINVAGGNSNEAQQFLSRGGSIIIRMRGLPYDCTAKQVVDFFEAGDNGCSILDNEDGVLFVKKHDGRATGDAFVLFNSEEDCTKALSKHRDIIGSRYIELFRSTTAEVQQVLNRSMDPRTFEQQQQPPLISQIPTAVPVIPPHMITNSSRRDCIRLRGLPYEAQVEHVLDFLGDYSKNIVFRGVHMVINPQGQPSGEAFIQMCDEQSAFQAAQNRHHRYMIFGKKQRYIEVFQCSGDDMSFVLSSAFQPQRAVVSPGGTVITSPFGTIPLAAAPPVISAVPTRLPPYPGIAYPTMFYWPYPSPPVSPNSPPFFSSAPPPHLASTPHHPAIIPAECIPIHTGHEPPQHNGEVVATM